MSTSASSNENENEVDSEDFAQMNGISSKNPEMPPATSSYQDAAPEEFLTRRNTWEQPWPKALLVGSGILGFVFVLGSMLHGTTDAFNGAVGNSKNPAAQSSTVDSRQVSKAKETDTDGDKDAKVALTTQINDLRNQKQQTEPTLTPSPLPTASVESDAPGTLPLRIKGLPRALPDDAPPQRVYRSTPSQKVPPIRESPFLKRAEVAPLDSAQAWAEASNAGTWRGSGLPQSGNAYGSDSASVGIEQRISSAGQFVASPNVDSVDSVAGGSTALTVPLAVKSKSLQSGDRRGRGALSGGQGEKSLCRSPATWFQAPGFIHGEEETFIERGSAQINNTSDSQAPAFKYGVSPLLPAPCPLPLTDNGASHSAEPNIPAGTRVKGVITAPITWSGNDGNSSPIEQVASIQLRENLTDSSGQVVLPDGSVVIAKITRATTSGLVTMVAMSAQTPQGDKSLPDNGVLVLAQGGRVIRAKVELPGNTGDSLGTAIYAGINKGAETINRPTSGSSSGYSGYGGGFQSFNFNSKNNVLAGVAEGVTGSLVQSGMARTQQRMQRLQSESPTYLIKEGTNVELCFNQSIPL